MKVDGVSNPEKPGFLFWTPSRHYGCHRSPFSTSKAATSLHPSRRFATNDFPVHTGRNYPPRVPRIFIAPWIHPSPAGVSLHHGPHCLGRYDGYGLPHPATNALASTRLSREVEMPPSLQPHPQKQPLLGISEATTLNPQPDISLATKSGHFNLLTAGVDLLQGGPGLCWRSCYKLLGQVMKNRDFTHLREPKLPSQSGHPLSASRMAVLSRR